MPDDQRLSYVQGAFDGFLLGYEAAKAGWNIDWVTKCLDSMTAGALRDASDKDAKDMADLVFDGAPLQVMVSVGLRRRTTSIGGLQALIVTRRAVGRLPGARGARACSLPPAIGT
jgi:hypothetical protein